MLESSSSKNPPNTLRELRESLGYSQEAFAAKIGLTRNAYARYESGLAEPKVSNFLIMAKELRVSLKELAMLMKFDTSHIPDDCTIDVTPNP